MNYAEYAERHHITCELTQVPVNPNMSTMSTMPPGTRHWHVLLEHGSRNWGPNYRTMSTYYSAGPGIERDPNVGDILACLAADASSIVNASDFADWCYEIGLLPIETADDLRSARNSYETIKKHSTALSELIGDELDDLLFRVEEV